MKDAKKAAADLSPPLQDAAPPPAQEPEMVKVRVLVETLGSPRAPIAHRGDIIDVHRDDFEKLGPMVFEDVAAAAAAKAEAEAPKQDPWFASMKDSMRAEREAAAAGRAIAERRTLEKVQANVQHFEKLSKE